MPACRACKCTLQGAWLINNKNCISCNKLIHWRSQFDFLNEGLSGRPLTMKLISVQAQIEPQAALVYFAGRSRYAVTGVSVGCELAQSMARGLPDIGLPAENGADSFFLRPADGRCRPSWICPRGASRRQAACSSRSKWSTGYPARADCKGAGGMICDDWRLKGSESAVCERKAAGMIR